MTRLHAVPPEGQHSLFGYIRREVVWFFLAGVAVGLSIGLTLWSVTLWP